MEQSNLELTHFPFGSEVCSKKLGELGVGRIVGILGARCVKELAGTAMVPEGYFSAWDQQYPSWQDKYVYHVAYKQSRKALTFEQFKLVLGQEFVVQLTEVELLAVYKSRVPDIPYEILPHDDLELFE